MIMLYSGTPGSGKSYHTIQAILRFLKSGRIVIANFPIAFTPKEIKKGYQARFIYVDTLEMSPNRFIDLRNEYVQKKVIRDKKEGEILVCIDECSIIFNPREYGNTNRIKWIQFLSQHRHYGFDLIFISQIDRMIDRQIRGLIEYEVKHRKLNNLSFPWYLFPVEMVFQIFCWVSHLSFFAAVTYWYPVRMRTEFRTFVFTPFVAKHYSTFYDFRQLEQQPPAQDGGEGAPVAGPASAAK